MLRLKGVELPGEAELREMCRNARRVVALCDLVGLDTGKSGGMPVRGTPPIELLGDPRASFSELELAEGDEPFIWDELELEEGF